MKMQKKNREQRVSGFTLLEMMVVIAIIAILTTVLVPTVRNYLTRSRLQTANSQAKVLFNSMQTIMQEYEFRERGMKESALYGAAKSGEIVLYVDDGHIENLTAPGDPGGSIDSSVLGTDYNSASPSSIGARIGRIYTDYLSTTWCVLIKDYSVCGVLCASSPNSQYIGGYPIQPTVSGEQCDGVNLKRLSDVNVATMGKYCDKAWEKPAETPPAETPPAEEGETPE